jgi:signal transduction histidine kinase
MKSISVKTVYLGFGEECFLVKTDLKRLQQVLLNLVSNAIKFTDRSGEIIILVEKYMEKGKVNLRVSVTDNGLGIKEENKSKLFNLFTSFKDVDRQINTDGIGLGLVISKLIVQKFNGCIDFFSEYQKGSTFFFTFELEPVQLLERSESI